MIDGMNTRADTTTCLSLGSDSFALRLADIRHPHPPCHAYTPQSSDTAAEQEHDEEQAHRGAARLVRAEAAAAAVDVGPHVEEEATVTPAQPPPSGRKSLSPWGSHQVNEQCGEKLASILIHSSCWRAPLQRNGFRVFGQRSARVSVLQLFYMT